jgi:hypothetical protein
MEKKSFYKVSQDAWIFNKVAKDREVNDAKWTAHEEFVRQWCIQELIRTYGVRIDCIEIERLVKVARERRPNRADIVVLREGNPHIVVECKARSFKKLNDALQQAMNYAILPGMQAAYAVATNGDDWLVCRRCNNDWIPVADLPDYRGGKASVEWRLLLMAIKDISPILYWLDRPVPKQFASNYFAALQRFFHCRNEITDSDDHNLLLVADNLLSVLANVNNHPNYTGGKMSKACKGLNNYWSDHGIKTDFGVDDFWQTAHYGYAELSALVKDNADIPSLDNALLRVFLSLFGYLNSIKSPKSVSYTDVSDSLQREIRSCLSLLLAVRFDAVLPDPLDKTGLGDIYDMCEPAWYNFVKEAN